MEEIKIRITGVEIPRHLEGDGGFNGGGKHWNSETLWIGSEKLEEFDFPLNVVNMSFNPWNIDNFRWMLYHLKRIENANLDYPIILDPDGAVADGWHRIAKAIMRGDLTIRAKKFSIMPEPDSIDSN
jgi:hypothetical protein